MSSPFSTHKPILDFYLKSYNGKVLEIGTGFDSTPDIINRSSYSISLEDDKEWLGKIKQYEKESHEIKFVDDWRQSFENCAGDFDLVFVDSGKWWSRCLAVEFFSQRAKIVLLHDSFPEHLTLCDGGLDIRRFFKYSHNYSFILPYVPESPPTIALSNFIDTSVIMIDGSLT